MARDNEQMVESLMALAMLCTASKSPFELAAKPADTLRCALASEVMDTAWLPMPADVPALTLRAEVLELLTLEGDALPQGKTGPRGRYAPRKPGKFAAKERKVKRKVERKRR